MHPHVQLLTDFYQAFQQRDATKMGLCYHDQVVFSDPVFPQLKGEEARAMWRMLCLRGKDLEISFSQIEADDEEGQAHWEARYTFSKTGHRVHNIISASFRFQDGLISHHQDRFDLHAWASMALGWKGKLWGWLPPVQSGIRKTAAHSLAAFEAREEG